MKSEGQIVRVEISYKTILFSVALLIGIWFLVTVKEVIIFLFLSIILLSALHRPVQWLNSKRIPKVISAILIYILLVAIIALTIGTIIPPLVSQTSDFLNRLPQIISTLNNFTVIYKIPAQDISQIISNQVQQFAGNFLIITKTIVSSLFLLITIFVFTFYLLLEWKKFIKLISSPFSGKQEKMVVAIVSQVENGLGYWLRGQLALSAGVGLLLFIGLAIIGVPFALPLAIIAAIFEIIPIVGPIVSAIPAILVALAVSPILALATVALYFVIQQIEGHIIVPMIMSKAVGIQPPIIILSLLIGAKLDGITGAFLAVPLIVVIKIIFKELINNTHNFEGEKLEEEI